MAFPPRFGVSAIPQTTFVPVYGPPMLPMVQTTPYLVPTLAGGVIASVNPRGPGAGGGHRGRAPLIPNDQRHHHPGRHPGPGGPGTGPGGPGPGQGPGGVVERPPPTTVFVGNIHENASNDLIKSMLAKCGQILQWKRVQGPNGRFQAFGFCEYDHPDSTLRAVRLLHEWKLGEKALTVKVDEKTKDVLREFVNKRREAQGKDPLKCEGDQLPCDEDMQREDAPVRETLTRVVQNIGPDLVEGNKGVVKARTPELYGKGGNLDIGSLDRERKEYIAREISTFRLAYQDDKKDPKKRHRNRGDHHDRDRDHQYRNRGDRDQHRRGGGGDGDDNNDAEQQRSRSRQQQHKSPSPASRGEPPQPPLVNSVPSRSRPDSRASSSATGGRGVGGGGRSPSPQESLTGSHQQQPPLGAWNTTAAAAIGGSTNRNTSSSNVRRESAEMRGAGGGRAAARKSRSRSRLDSDDEEMSFERRRLERKMREKEEAYLGRLKVWENRERKRGRDYDRHRLKQKVQRREELREAKKLKEFLEDYDDERDDSKYYSGKNYDIRRREFEKERETDVKDRQREREEFEEIKAKLLEEGISDPEEEIAKIQKEQEERLSKRFAGSDSSASPSPVPVLQRPKEEDEDDEGVASSAGGSEAGRRRRQRSAERYSREQSRNPEDSGDAKSRFIPAAASDTSKTGKPAAPISFGGLKLSLAASSSVVGSAQTKLPASSNRDNQQDDYKDRGGDDDDEDDEEDGGASGGDGRGKSGRSRRLVPLEYTEEEKQAVGGGDRQQGSSSAAGDQHKRTPLTGDEKKKMVKALIEKIPTAKEELFAYPISWNQVDQALIDRRLKPWVTKKIVEYIGEDEQSLVEFICQKVNQRTPPQTIIEDISMVLDEEAGVFVVKLWRLLIYEIEAKKAGLVKGESAS